MKNILKAFIRKNELPQPERYDDSSVADGQIDKSGLIDALRY
jgi:hypothetical protein